MAIQTEEIKNRAKIETLMNALDEDQLEQLMENVQVNVERDDMASDVLQAIADAPPDAKLFEFKWYGDIWLFVALSEDDIPGIIEQGIK